MLLKLWHSLYPTLLTEFSMLVFFMNLGFTDFQVRYLALLHLFLVIDVFEWLWMGSLHKNIQLIMVFLKVPFLVLHFSYNTLMTFLMMLPVILLSMLTILLSNLQCHQASDLWQQLESASELESNLWDTVDWGRKWLVDFNTWETQLVLFDRSNNTGTIDVKMNGSILEEKSSFQKLGLTFSSKLDWGSYIFSIAKTASMTIGALIHSTKFICSIWP